MEENKDYIADFEKKLRAQIMSMCRAEGFCQERMQESEDITLRWDVLAPGYMTDAVANSGDYPVVSLAWAAFLGMAVANEWETDWMGCKNRPYANYYGKDGFDDMDEHIVRDILKLPLASKEAKRIVEFARSCAETALTVIRHENLDHQSEQAYRVFVAACKAMYMVGQCVELARLGYKMEKMNM